MQVMASISHHKTAERMEFTVHSKRFQKLLERHPLILTEVLAFLAPVGLLAALAASVCAVAFPLCWLFGY